MAFPFNFFQHIVNDISGRIVGPEGINPLELLDEPRYEVYLTGEIQQPNNDRLNYNVAISGDFQPHSGDLGTLSIGFSGDFSYMGDRPLYQVSFSGDFNSNMIDFANYAATVTGEVFGALCDRFSYTVALMSGEVVGQADRMVSTVNFSGRAEPAVKDRVSADIVLVAGYYRYDAAIIRRELTDELEAGIFLVSGRYYQPVS